MKGCAKISCTSNCCYYFNQHFFLQFTVMCCIPDICCQRHQHVCGEKICHVECGIFFMWQIIMGKKLSTWEMWNNSVMWRRDMYNFWRFVALNDSKISFVAINVVLSRIFCPNLRAFVWRKFVQKIVCVEKKRQISGMMCWDIN